MEFPRMVYRPGTAWALEAGTFDLRTVSDATELEAAEAEGWRLDQYAALDAVQPVEADKPADVPPDDAPPTRDELLQKAAELGLTVDRRWGDARIAAAIAEALKG